MAMRAFQRIAKACLALGGAAALGACGGPAEDAADTDGDGTVAIIPPVTAGPPPAFGQCVACHAVKPGVNGVGPSLHGVVGRQAGTLSGYAYSEPLKAWGKVFDETTLDQFLTAPMKEVPGTKMVFPGMPDPERRKAVIDYLATLK
jgi:cytochrome c